MREEWGTKSPEKSAICSKNGQTRKLPANTAGHWMKTVVFRGSRWFFRRPQSAGSLIDPALSEWEKTAKPVTLTFERTQMLNAVGAYLEMIRTTVANDAVKFCWPVYGLSVQDVLKMNPNQPFYEIEEGA